MKLSKIEPMHGQVAMITGANTGIGLAAARMLAKAGARVLLACRSEAPARRAVELIRSEGGAAEFIPLDLGDFQSVQRCVEAFHKLDAPLHVLVNNAGMAGQRGLTKSGFELTFGTNYMGHFLLTKLLLPALQNSGAARVIHVSSEAHYKAKAIDWQAVRESTRSRTCAQEYAVSKLANVLFNAELARRTQGKGITSYAVHPGLIASDVWRNVPQPFRWLMINLLPMKSVDEGAENTAFCASAPALAAHTGLYYHDLEPREPSPLARDPKLAQELWERSEAWLLPS